MKKGVIIITKAYEVDDIDQPPDTAAAGGVLKSEAYSILTAQQVQAAKNGGGLSALIGYYLKNLADFIAGQL